MLFVFADYRSTNNKLASSFGMQKKKKNHAIIYDTIFVSIS